MPRRRSNHIERPETGSSRSLLVFESARFLHQTRIFGGQGHRLSWSCRRTSVQKPGTRTGSGLGVADSNRAQAIISTMFEQQPLAVVS